jgi:DNA-directed RNA polymerase
MDSIDNINKTQTTNDLDNLLAEELLRHRQLDLEELSVELGVRRYQKEIQEWSLTSPSHAKESAGIPGQYLLAANVRKLSAGIAAWRDDVTLGKARRQALLLHVLGELDTDTMALIALSKIVDCMGSELSLQQCAGLIVPPILDEINYRRFKSGAPGYEYVVREAFKQDTSQRHRTKMLKKCIEQAKVMRFEVDPKEKQAICNLLVDLTITSTGICTLGKKATARDRHIVILEPAEHIVEWLETIHAQCSKLSPVMMPMLVQPNDWTSIYSGGYLSSKLRRPLVKTRNSNYLDELENVDMPQVYDAVNHIQRTAWQVNNKILEVMNSVWESGRTLGKLPPRDNMPLPAKPHDISTNTESRREWAGIAHVVHVQNCKLSSKRIAMAQKLWMANRYKDEDRFYYPHNLDWRSRIYPMAGVGSMNPQGDDTGKALLQFAEGVALGEFGGYWLAVHIANLFGVDKISFDDRVAWVVEHEAELLLSVIDPLEYQMWTTADKPWCALAAIYEWDAYRRAGDTFVSHLPIAMDGSNNGAQHLSAMGRDAIATVNLVPAATPQDIYTDVMNLVTLYIDALAASDDEDALFWQGRITRALAKRPVMTLCYGATKRGMSLQIRDEIYKSDPELFAGMKQVDMLSRCSWLAAIMYDQISISLYSASTIMAWLRAASRIASSNDLPIRWQTPAGFPVLQAYQNSKHETLESIIAGARVQLHLVKETTVINRAKQANGISPNYVHSLDAAHLMRSTNAMSKQGISSIAMIHDSYAVHAAHVDTMNYLIRQQFVEMYSEDVLQSFSDQLAEQLPQELSAKITAIPDKGTLELADIIDSEFFFA